MMLLLLLGRSNHKCHHHSEDAVIGTTTAATIDATLPLLGYCYQYCNATAARMISYCYFNAGIANKDDATAIVTQPPLLLLRYPCHRWHATAG